MPLIRDPSLRAGLYPKVEPLLARPAAGAGDDGTKAKAVDGRYVRIELPGQQRTLTLAEVEVFSDGRNVARAGQGDAEEHRPRRRRPSRAIDGNTSGTYGDGGQTHTEENTTNPWWEVDLGAEYPIDSIVVYNRTDGDLGKRLNGFTLKVLDDRPERRLPEGEAARPRSVKATFERRRRGAGAGRSAARR